MPLQYSTRRFSSITMKNVYTKHRALHVIYSQGGRTLCNMSATSVNSGLLRLIFSGSLGGSIIVRDSSQ